MTALGTFPVEASAEEVAAFRMATGMDAADPAVPTTFPIRWMVTAEVRAAIGAMLPEPDLIPVHESQTFDYERALIAGEPYRLELSATRETAPDRLLVEGTIAAADGPSFARIETVLRLFGTGPAASDTPAP